MGTAVIDLLVVSVPVLDLQYPPSSPAIIKACAQAAGFSARTLDLNIELLQLAGTRNEFYQVQYNFENVTKLYTNQFFNGILGTFLYLNPGSAAFMLYKEIYRLEVKLFNIKIEKESNFYKKLIF